MSVEDQLPEDPSAEDSFEIDREGLNAFMAEAVREQSFFGGLCGGLAAALIGAVGWALLTVLTEKEFALVAIAVGLLVGYGVRLGGKGLGTSFGVMGAVLAMFGCVLGKLLALSIVVANAGEELSVLQVVFAVLTSPLAAFELLKITFHPLDLLFYGVALYEGYRFSFRVISEAELAQFVRPAPPGAVGEVGPPGEAGS